MDRKESQRRESALTNLSSITGKKASVVPLDGTTPVEDVRSALPGPVTSKNLLRSVRSTAGMMLKNPGSVPWKTKHTLSTVRKRARRMSSAMDDCKAAVQELSAAFVKTPKPKSCQFDITGLRFELINEQLEEYGPVMWNPTAAKVVVTGAEGKRTFRSNGLAKSSRFDAASTFQFPFLSLTVLSSMHPFKWLQHIGQDINFFDRFYPVLAKYCESYYMQLAAIGKFVSIQDAFERLYYHTTMIMLFGKKPDAMVGMLTFKEFRWYASKVTKASSPQFVYFRKRLECCISRYCQNYVDRLRSEQTIQGQDVVPSYCLLAWLQRFGYFEDAYTLEAFVTHMIHTLVYGVFPTSATCARGIASSLSKDGFSVASSKLCSRVPDNTYSSLLVHKTHYLDATIKEAMRVQSPVPYTFRTSSQTSLSMTVKSGKTIRLPPETPMMFSIYHENNDPTYWENPSDFDVSRWKPKDCWTREDCSKSSEALPNCPSKLERNKTWSETPLASESEDSKPGGCPHKGKFHPFGVGPKACPAENTALFWIRSVLSLLFSRFELEINGSVAYGGDHIMNAVLCPGVNMRVEVKEYIPTYFQRFASFDFQDHYGILRFCFPSISTNAVTQSSSCLNLYTVTEMKYDGDDSKYQTTFVENGCTVPTLYHRVEGTRLSLRVLEKHHSYYLALMQLTSSASHQPASALVRTDSLLPNQHLGRDKVVPCCGFSFVEFDEDEGQGNASLLINQLLEKASFEMEAHNRCKTTKSREWFDSDEDATEAWETAFLPYLGDTLVNWGPDVSSDRSLTNMVFYGPAQWFLERLVPGGRDEKCYVCDVSYLGDFDVGRRHIKYGAKVYFDKSKQPVSIEWGDGWTSNKSTVVKEKWEAAKYAFRASFIAESTIRHYLCTIKYHLANSFMLAAREGLGVDHPIRRLLKPHYYRTAAVNWSCATLMIPTGGLLHRTFSFSSQTLAEVYSRCVRDWHFETLPSFISRKGLTPEDQEGLPLAKDGLEYWGILKDYVGAYVNLFYNESREVEEDREIAQYWKIVHVTRDTTNKGFPAPKLNKESFIDHLVHSIWWVTAGAHLFSTSVRDYAKSPQVGPTILIDPNSQGVAKADSKVAGTKKISKELFKASSHKVQVMASTVKQIRQQAAENKRYSFLRRRPTMVLNIERMCYAKSDIRGFMCLHTTLGFSKSVRQPGLIGSWQHLFSDLLDPTDTARANALNELLQKFQADLDDLSKRVANRNKYRPLPFRAMDPSYLESSI